MSMPGEFDAFRPYLSDSCVRSVVPTIGHPVIFSSHCFMPAQRRQARRSTNQQTPAGRPAGMSTPYAIGPRSVAPHSHRSSAVVRDETDSDTDTVHRLIIPLFSLLASKCLHISPVTVRHALSVALPLAGGLDPLESHQDRLIDHHKDQPLLDDHARFKLDDLLSKPSSQEK